MADEMGPADGIGPSRGAYSGVTDVDAVGLDEKGGGRGGTV